MGFGWLPEWTVTVSNSLSWNCVYWLTVAEFLNIFYKKCVSKKLHWIRFSLRISIFSCQYHSTSVPYLTSSTHYSYRKHKWANLRHRGEKKNHVILHLVSPSVTKYSNLFLRYSCTFPRAFENWYSNAVAFKLIAHKLLSLLERKSGVRTSRHRKPNSDMGWHCLWRLRVLSVCLPKVTQRKQLTETVRTNIERFPSAA
jgi:hypothetical protein